MGLKEQGPGVRGFLLTGIHPPSIVSAGPSLENPMPTLSLALLAILLAFGCGGKVLTQWPRQEIFSTFVRHHEVKLGMSREEVEGLMGPPKVREKGKYRGGSYELYFYRTHNMDYKGSGTVRGGYTPFVFENGRLVGKGKRAYIRAVDRPWSEDTSPAPSRDPSIFRPKTW